MKDRAVKGRQVVGVLENYDRQGCVSVLIPCAELCNRSGD